MAVFAPTPKASVSKIVSVSPGFLSSMRKLKRRLRSRLSIDGCTSHGFVRQLGPDIHTQLGRLPFGCRSRNVIRRTLLFVMLRTVTLKTGEGQLLRHRHNKPTG